MLLGTTRQEKRKDWDCCLVSLRPAGSQIGRQRGAPMTRAKHISLLVVITLLTLSLFPQLVAAVTWLTRLLIEWSMLFWFAFTRESAI